MRQGSANGGDSILFSREVCEKVREKAHTFLEKHGRE
jgi:hypothetical protein